jgi:hypothetical protein
MSHGITTARPLGDMGYIYTRFQCFQDAVLFVEIVYIISIQGAEDARTVKSAVIIY